jgi:predicted AAA+ superfamily ATPase
MPRADLLVALVRAWSRHDDATFRRSLEAMAAEERGKQHHVLADRLAEYLNGSNETMQHVAAPQSTHPVAHLMFELLPRKRLEDLILPPKVAIDIGDLVAEQQRASLLRSRGLEPRHKILLVGPPGNGKTSLAEAIADALMLPFYVVRYEGLVGSYLGETAQRLRQVFDTVRTRECVLFFDEFDTLGKERGDPHDTGEVKRVVSSLLLQIDALPSYVVVIAATNHPELLDRAVWRRFDLRLQLPPPSDEALRHWLEEAERLVGVRFPGAPDTTARGLAGLSYGELEELRRDIQRHLMLGAADEMPERTVSERLSRFLDRRREWTD